MGGWRTIQAFDREWILDQVPKTLHSKISSAVGDWMAFCALGTLPPVAANTRDVTPDNRLALRLSQPHSTAAAALRTEPFEPD